MEKQKISADDFKQLSMEIHNLADTLGLDDELRCQLLEVVTSRFRRDSDVANKHLYPYAGVAQTTPIYPWTVIGGGGVSVQDTGVNKIFPDIATQNGIYTDGITYTATNSTTFPVINETKGISTFTLSV